MGDDQARPGGSGDGRQERLARALRENLRRRKAQARARAGKEAPPGQREPRENEPD